MEQTRCKFLVLNFGNLKVFPTDPPTQPQNCLEGDALSAKALLRLDKSKLMYQLFLWASCTCASAWSEFTSNFKHHAMISVVTMTCLMSALLQVARGGVHHAVLGFSSQMFSESSGCWVQCTS
eukprot:5456439-Amphidinium_carterae.2